MDGSERGGSAWAEAGAALDRLIGAARAGWSSPDAVPSDPAAILSQAAVIGLFSLLRSGAEFATLLAGRPALARALAVPAQELSEAERRELVEEARKLMRELGELASREARRFQSDLASLALRLASDQAEPATAAGPRRYARTKP